MNLAYFQKKSVLLFCYPFSILGGCPLYVDLKKFVLTSPNQILSLRLKRTFPAHFNLKNYKIIVIFRRQRSLKLPENCSHRPLLGVTWLISSLSLRMPPVSSGSIKGRRSPPPPMVGFPSSKILLYNSLQESKSVRTAVSNSGCRWILACLPKEKSASVGRIRTAQPVASKPAPLLI